ncbi:MAG: tetratricopeptide repeat protein [Myxococcota bacterium]
MFGFGKAAPYNREDALRRAEEFRSRKKPKKAIAELRKVLAVDPKDAAAHAKLGPLLLTTGETSAALESFRIAADDLDARGFSDKALSLWLQIAQARVSDLDAWEKVTQFHASRGRKADAVKVLLQASGLQEGREGRPRAVRLLEDALVFEPKHLEATLALAPLLSKEKRRDEARALLENALTFTSGPAARRVRKRLFLLFPGFKTFWRWIRA